MKKSNRHSNIDKPEKKRIITQKRVNIALLIIILAAIIAGVTAKTAGPKIKTFFETHFASEDNGESNTKLKSYKGGKLPAEYIEILKQAEEEEKAACEKYGVAFTVGDMKFSLPHAVMVYIDAYSNHYSQSAIDTVQYGYSKEGFSFETYPEWNNTSDGKKWGRVLIDEASQTVADNYYMFYKALKDGFIPDEEQFEQITYSYEFIKSYLNQYNGEISQMMTKHYHEGVTYNMYAASRIVSLYATYYKNYLTEKYSGDVTQKKAEEYIEGKENDYKVFCGRVYLMKNDDGSWKNIKNEEEYLSFVVKAQNNEDFREDEATNAYYSYYADVVKAYNSELADYLFSPERKAGEISTFKSGNRTFLVYTDQPAHFEKSVSCIVYYTALTRDNEDIAKQEQEAFDTFVDKWIKSGAREQNLLLQCRGQGNPIENYPYGETDLRVNSMYTDIDRWLRDPARKKGDYETFRFDNINALVYFKKANNDDFDWIEKVKEEISTAKIEEEFSHEDDKEWEVIINEDMLSNIYNAAHDPINVLIGGI